MNQNAKKAAVKRFSALLQTGITVDELKAAIASDEKKYSSSDQEEILAEVTEASEVDSLENETDDDGYEGNKVYEEYRVEWNINEKEKNLSTAEKLKKIREVKISIEEADIMNGECNQHNPIAYYQK